MMTPELHFHFWRLALGADEFGLVSPTNSDVKELECGCGHFGPLTKSYYSL
jgi:hypothetical protein